MQPGIFIEAVFNESKHLKEEKTLIFNRKMSTMQQTSSMLDSKLEFPTFQETAQKESRPSQAAAVGFVTSDAEVPVTVQRQMPINLNEKLEHPEISRFSEAASVDHPYGSPGTNNKRRSVVQQHCDFFDSDHDDIISPYDTYNGFRRIGFNILFSILAVFVIHPFFFLLMSPGWFPDPFMRINLNKIHRGIHGSDSKVFDYEGRFMPQRFEEIFTKWDNGQKGGLSLIDIWRMTQANWNTLDFFGWFAGKFEWFALWLLAHDEKGLLNKEAVRSCYDGTLFYKMEKKFFYKQPVEDEYKNMGEPISFRKPESHSAQPQMVNKEEMTKKEE